MENIENPEENRQLVELVHSGSDSTFRVFLTEYEINRANSGKLKTEFKIKLFSWKPQIFYVLIIILTYKEHVIYDYLLI